MIYSCLTPFCLQTGQEMSGGYDVENVVSRHLDHIFFIRTIKFKFRLTDFSEITRLGFFLICS